MSYEFHKQNPLGIEGDFHTYIVPPCEEGGFNMIVEGCDGGAGWMAMTYDGSYRTAFETSFMDLTGLEFRTACAELMVLTGADLILDVSEGPSGKYKFLRVRFPTEAAADEGAEWLIAMVLSKKMRGANNG